jgi:hypothetical protein
MKKNDGIFDLILAVLWILLLPFVILGELLKKTK